MAISTPKVGLAGPAAAHDADPAPGQTYQYRHTYSIPAARSQWPALGERWQGWYSKGPDPERPGYILAEVIDAYGF